MTFPSYFRTEINKSSQSEEIFEIPAMIQRWDTNQASLKDIPLVHILI